MTGYRYPVMLLGGGSVNSLGIARNLGGLGIDVACATAVPNELIVYSKYCRNVFLVPGVEDDPQCMMQFLLAQSHRFTRMTYLHPTSDLAVLALSKILPALDHYVASIPDQTTVETLVVKRHFYESLASTSVPYPRTIFVDAETIAAIDSDVSYPIFVKPSLSQLFTRTFHRKGFVVRDAGELRTYLRVVAQHGLDVMLQEIIPGPATNIYTINGYFDAQSRPRLLIARRKIRQPTLFSNNSVTQTIPLADVAEPVQQVVEYLASLKYRGLFTSEWKRDTQDGRFYLLEVNARSGNLNHHVVQCGMNHILLAYCDAVGLPFDPSPNYRTGVYCITFLKDLESITRLAWHRNISLRDLIQPYLEPHKWATMSWEDPLPFFLYHVRAFLDRVTSKRVSSRAS